MQDFRYDLCGPSSRLFANCHHNGSEAAKC